MIYIIIKFIFSSTKRLLQRSNWRTCTKQQNLNETKWHKLARADKFICYVISNKFNKQNSKSAKFGANVLLIKLIINFNRKTNKLMLNLFDLGWFYNEEIPLCLSLKFLSLLTFRYTTKRKKKGHLLTFIFNNTSFLKMKYVIKQPQNLKIKSFLCFFIFARYFPLLFVSYLLGDKKYEYH